MDHWKRSTADKCSATYIERLNQMLITLYFTSYRIMLQSFIITRRVKSAIHKYARIAVQIFTERSININEIHTLLKLKSQMLVNFKRAVLQM